jgi:hypothetical protein
VKITVDSSEPLEDALRVLGALYGVTLVVSPGDHSDTEPVHKRAAKPAPKRRSASRKRPAAVEKSSATAAAAEAGDGQSDSEPAAVSAGAPSNAQVRAWARENGARVSDRGRVPASVVDAYRRAHNR